MGVMNFPFGGGMCSCFSFLGLLRMPFFDFLVYLFLVSTEGFVSQNSAEHWEL